MTGADENTVAAGLFAAIAVLVGADLLADAGSGAGAVHLGAEGLATFVALAGAGWFLVRFRKQRAETRQLRARADELLGGVGGTIEKQFAAWRLTPAEAEVALLLLKGLAFKEIAGVRGTGERTAREQARTVYKKAAVGGRAELSAWFIEDLL
ncbi:MAG: helix-turn-helix transcriptional regulator [Deltaproteobacteria bacterium]|nr:helix-turn-helix transcriptional regulator [Deltaproteobacteria bacterium]